MLRFNHGAHARYIDTSLKIAAMKAKVRTCSHVHVVYMCELSDVQVKVWVRVEVGVHAMLNDHEFVVRLLRNLYELSVVSPGNHVQLEGKTEYRLEEQCEETEQFSMTAVALVDVSQQRTYGIKVHNMFCVHVFFSYLCDCQMSMNCFRC